MTSRWWIFVTIANGMRWWEEGKAPGKSCDALDDVDGVTAARNLTPNLRQSLQLGGGHSVSRLLYCCTVVCSTVLVLNCIAYVL